MTYLEISTVIQLSDDQMQELLKLSRQINANMSVSELLEFMYMQQQTEILNMEINYLKAKLESIKTFLGKMDTGA